MWERRKKAREGGGLCSRGEGRAHRQGSVHVALSPCDENWSLLSTQGVIGCALGRGTK